MGWSAELNLKAHLTTGAQVVQTGSAVWRLEIPAGPAGRYRLAQVDDYHQLPRRGFRWQPPLSLSLRARASAESIPGTWGFGLWNDPFGLAFLKGGGVRLPALPNAAWFFFASPPNYLSLRDDLPAQGALATTFRSVHVPALLLALAAPALPALLAPPLARLLRRRARDYVRQEASSLAINPTQMHAYNLTWTQDKVFFAVDETLVLETTITPLGPLGLVLWVDNQYAAFPPDGRLRYGTLANGEASWVEIESLQYSSTPLNPGERRTLAY